MLMKTLILLRHAKSSWNDATVDDFDRPLNDRGRKAAGKVGKFLAKQETPIDLVLSSPAIRARQTLDLVLKRSALTPETRLDQRIYEASSSRLLEVVSQIDEDRKSVMLVGHNPGMEELLSLLTGSDERMQTAALATISLDVKRWDRVIAGKGVLESLVRVKELKGETN